MIGQVASIPGLDGSSLPSLMYVGMELYKGPCLAEAGGGATPSGVLGASWPAEVASEAEAPSSGSETDGLPGCAAVGWPVLTALLGWPVGPSLGTAGGGVGLLPVRPGLASALLPASPSDS